MNSRNLSLILHHEDTKDANLINKLRDKYIYQHQGADQHIFVIQTSQICLGFVLERAQGLRRTQEQVKITLETTVYQKINCINSNTKGLIIFFKKLNIGMRKPSGQILACFSIIAAKTF